MLFPLSQRDVLFPMPSLHNEPLLPYESLEIVMQYKCNTNPFVFGRVIDEIVMSHTVVHITSRLRRVDLSKVRHAAVAVKVNWWTIHRETSHAKHRDTQERMSRHIIEWGSITFPFMQARRHPDIQSRLLFIQQTMCSCIFVAYFVETKLNRPHLSDKNEYKIENLNGIVAQARL